MRTKTPLLICKCVILCSIAIVRAPVVAYAQSKRQPHAQAGAQSSSRTATPRRWLPAPTFVRSIVGPDGDELLMPSSLVATVDGQLAVFDFGAMELRAFSTDGRQLWRIGRKGSGPGEFRNAMDVKVLSNGNITVLDMGNRRITAVSQTGRLVRTVPVRLSASRFIPLADTTRFALATDDSGALWAAINLRGDVIERSVAPPALTFRHTLAKEMFTASLGAGAVVTFRWSNRFAILNANGGIATLVDGIEPIPFPAIKSYPMKIGRFTGQVSRVDPHAVPGALSVTSNGQQIFVLFAGATPNRERILDLYSAVTGTYIGSHLLAVPVSEVVALPNHSFATLRSDPIPSIDIWAESAVIGGASSTSTSPKPAGKGRSK